MESESKPDISPEQAESSEDEIVQKYEELISKELPNWPQKSEQEIVDLLLAHMKSQSYYPVPFEKQVVEGMLIRKALHNLVEQGKIVEREGDFEVIVPES